MVPYELVFGNFQNFESSGQKTNQKLNKNCNIYIRISYTSNIVFNKIQFVFSFFLQ